MDPLVILLCRFKTTLGSYPLWLIILIMVLSSLVLSSFNGSFFILCSILWYAAYCTKVSASGLTISIEEIGELYI
jgi:hypothetical protein